MSLLSCLARAMNMSMSASGSTASTFFFAISMNEFIVLAILSCISTNRLNICFDAVIRRVSTTCRSFIALNVLRRCAVCLLRTSTTALQYWASYFLQSAMAEAADFSNLGILACTLGSLAFLLASSRVVMAFSAFLHALS